MPSPSAFILEQRAAQAQHFASLDVGGVVRDNAPWRLRPEHGLLNLSPAIRERARSYFENHGIVWHLQADHGLSSQAACVNFLMPLATRPTLLARLVGRALDIEAPDMLPIETGPNGVPWYVGFEWTARADHLGEWPASGTATRGAHVTSADAIVRFRHEGLVETILIEWKYTESYRGPLDARGHETRIARYADIAFQPTGRIRGDLGLKVEDFFWEPFYQMLRQQMLAQRMEAAREDGADRVRVLHLSPQGNRDLHKITAPAFRTIAGTPYADAFDAFRALLAPPADGVPRFTCRSTEQAFAPILKESGGDPWADYLTGRYSFLRWT
jgi:hypothetical protein